MILYLIYMMFDALEREWRGIASLSPAAVETDQQSSRAEPSWIEKETLNVD